MRRNVTFPTDRSNTEAAFSPAQDTSSVAKSARYKHLRAANLVSHGRGSRIFGLVSKREVSSWGSSVCVNPPDYLPAPNNKAKHDCSRQFVHFLVSWLSCTPPNTLTHMEHAPEPKLPGLLIISDVLFLNRCLAL